MATAPEDDRFAQFEQLVARLQDEVRDLKATSAAPSSGRARTTSVSRVKRSRRALLKLGGAAAAAGMAGHATAHSDIAYTAR